MSTSEIIRDVTINRFKVGYYPDQAKAEFICAVFNAFNRDGLFAYYSIADKTIKTR